MLPKSVPGFHGTQRSIRRPEVKRILFIKPLFQLGYSGTTESHTDQRLECIHAILDDGEQWFDIECYRTVKEHTLYYAPP